MEKQKREDRRDREGSIVATTLLPIGPPPAMTTNGGERDSAGRRDPTSG